MGHAIVFVHLGDTLPPWLDDTLFQARLFNTGPIYLVAEAAALKGASSPHATMLALEEIGISQKQARFRQISFLDRNFRGGFWSHTTERFFVLESAMAALGLASALHLENDVLLYADLDALAPKLASLYPALAGTFDSDLRCVPGFFYIAQAAALARLTNFLLSALQTLAKLPREEVQSLNDMILLAEYAKRARGEIGYLPVVPPDYPAPLRSATGLTSANPALLSRHFTELKLVFDAAALGQYLGGLDPHSGPFGDSRASRGFVNESCLFDPRLLKPRMVEQDGLRRPMIETPSGLHAVANLHLHAKQMGDFLSAPRP